MKAKISACMDMDANDEIVVSSKVISGDDYIRLFANALAVIPDCVRFLRGVQGKDTVGVRLPEDLIEKGWGWAQVDTYVLLWNWGSGLIQVSLKE